MQVSTNISNVIDTNADKSKYDTEVKKVLSDKQILAWILKYSTKEFKDCSIEQIIGCIEGEPEIAKRHVYPGHYKEKIDGMNTENSVVGEGKITYDIRFRVRLLEGGRAGMIINVEAQKDYNPGYDIVTRGVFYCTRLLSAQMENGVSSLGYDNLQKVYSIWICLDVPPESEHSIVRYRMTEEVLHGKAAENRRYDLIETVMVYLGKKETVEKGTRLHGLLNTVLSERLKPKEKKSILEREYNIVTSVELEGSMVKMCNLSEAIEEKAIERGIEKGIEKGIIEGKFEISISLVKKGLLSLEDAAEELGMEVQVFKELYDDAMTGETMQ